MENLTENSRMEAAAGEKMARMILILLVHVAEYILLVIEGPFPVIRLVVNVQGKTRIYQSGPWMMTLPEEQQEEPLIHQVIKADIRRTRTSKNR